MTVTYSLDVSSSTFLGLHKLLFRWKGSIWKSTYQELSLWLFIYFILSATYRLVLDKPQQRLFEDVAVFCYAYGDFIPITFMLGFYVSAVFARWGEIFNNLGWIDTPALLFANYIQGCDETTRLLRRNCVRYLVLMQAMVYRDVSVCVKKRFPTYQHLVTAGLMTEKELKAMESIESPHIKYWQPINWVMQLLKTARDQKKIDSDIIYVDLMEKVRQYRVTVMTLTLYDWVSVPLVYTQVVNLAVRSYFLVGLMGRQYLLTERDFIITKTIDLYIPIMTILQFLFYIGWMKVAEVLLNPFGEDDDDFECNYILDRNLQVGFSIVDDACNRRSEMERDIFWHDKVPEPLYTVESAARPVNPNIGSCTEMIGDPGDQLMLKKRMQTSSINDHRPSLDAVVMPVVGVKKRCDNNFTPPASMRRNHSIGNIRNFLWRKVANFRSRENSVTSISVTPDESLDKHREADKDNHKLQWENSSKSGVSVAIFETSRSGSTRSIMLDAITVNDRWETQEDDRVKQCQRRDSATGCGDENIALNCNMSETIVADRHGQSPNAVWSTVNELLPVIAEEECKKYSSCSTIAAGDSRAPSEKFITPQTVHTNGCTT